MLPSSKLSLSGGVRCRICDAGDERLRSDIDAALERAAKYHAACEDILISLMHNIPDEVCYHVGLTGDDVAGSTCVC
jgi:hypothetical protein